MHTLVRSMLALGIAIGLPVAVPSQAKSQDAAARQLAQSCSRELQAYCSGVTVGGGRKLACLFAHNDKLSVPCEVALYLASIHLERALTAVRRVADECRSDIHAHCSRVVPGQGRIAVCLKANEAALSERCRVALADAQPRN